MEFPFLHRQFERNQVTLRQLEVFGFSLAELYYRPNVDVSAHAHEQANFCIALEGGCTEVYATKARTYKPLMLGFLPPYQKHSLKSSNKGMLAFTVNIAPHWLERMREYSLNVENSVFCAGGMLVELLMKIYHEFQNTDAASPLAVEGLALEMLAEVARYQTKESGSLSPRWLKQAMEIVHEQFSSHLSLHTIAGEIGIHPVHLARSFRRYHRCTVGEYIRNLRVEDACRKISASEIPLSEIALTSGFSDQSHFIRIFKRLKGITPAEYRIKHRIR